jgi:hypothetical protein
LIIFINGEEDIDTKKKLTVCIGEFYFGDRGVDAIDHYIEEVAG